MSQDDHENNAPGAPAAPPANESAAKDRREFIRQSLGVAPLMLTLGGRSYGGGTSMHGTLWSSLGVKWKHKGKWFEWKKRRWHWSKKSGDSYRDRDEHIDRDRKDNKTVPARKDWDWDKSDDRWRRKLEADAKHSDDDWKRQRADDIETEPEYDWRKDDDWKRSEGLSPFASARTDRKKD